MVMFRWHIYPAFFLPDFVVIFRHIKLVFTHALALKNLVVYKISQCMHHYSLHADLLLLDFQKCMHAYIHAFTQAFQLESRYIVYMYFWL